MTRVGMVRPLEKKAQHHHDKGGVLRVSHPGIGPVHGQSLGPLCPIQDAPENRQQQRQPCEDQHLADNMRRSECAGPCLPSRVCQKWPVSCANGSTSG